MGDQQTSVAAGGPIADASRLRALRATGLTGTSPVPSLDRLTALAARLAGAPVALVSLVGEHSLTAPAASGPIGVREVPLAHSHCRYVVEDDQPLIVADARTDERLAGSPAIERFGAVAYAGFPLRTPAGQVLGSFCVMDSRPRRWTPEELMSLQDLAAAAESEIAARLANAELLQVATRLQAVLDSAHDPFVSVAANGRVLAWNGAAEHLFGLPAAQALDRPITALIVPAENRDTFLADLARAAAEPAASDVRLRRPVLDTAGRRLLVEITVRLTSENETPVWHAFLRDVTADDAAEQQRRHQQEMLDAERTFLQALLDSLDTGVAACDGDGRLTLFNQALRGIHDADVAAVGPADWAETYQLYAEDGRTPLLADQVPLTQAMAGHTVRGRPIVIRPPGRPARRFVTNARPIDSPDGRRLGAVVAMHDVTEQHRAEQLHRAQHAVTQALAEATSAEHAGAGAVAAITTNLDWACGQYWQVDDRREGIDLISTYCAPRLPAPVDTAVNAALAEQVWRRGTELWTDSPQPGLGARVGVPIHSADRVLGVLTFVTGGRPLYDEGTAAMLEAARTHVGRFVERRHAEDLTLALAAAHRDFARVVDRVNDYVWTVEITADGATRSVFASPDGSGVFGAVLPTDADMAAEMAARIHPDDLLAFAGFHHAAAAGRPAEIECRVVGDDGVTRWVWTRAVPRREQDRLYVDGISTNVTERHDLAEQQQAAARTAQEAQQLLTAVGAVSRRVRSGEDARTTILSAIQQLAGADFVGLLEPDPAQPAAALAVTAAVGAPLTGLRIPLDEASLTAGVYGDGQAIYVPDIAAEPGISRRLIPLTDARSVLWQPVVADETVIAVLTAAWRHRTAALDEHRARAVALLSDETAMALIHERLLRRLEQMAHTDTLTGLANRRTWQTDLPRLFARARRTGQPLTVAIIDLDHFKRYNDTHGHPAGDEHLRRSAAAFSRALRDGDLIVRWGGEEFAAALVDCAGVDATTVLERVRTATPGGQTCSIGHATWDGTETVEQLLARADTALYAAKNAGRDTVRSAGEEHA